MRGTRKTYPDRHAAGHHMTSAFRHQVPTPSNTERTMLETIAVILIVLWLLGMVSSYTIGGFIHVLLVLAIIIFLLRVFRGRSPV